MSASNENEIALFVYITPESVLSLRQRDDYKIITQSEVRMSTEKKTRVTTRVRRTEDNKTGEVVFESAIKYRLPFNADKVSRSVELENTITEEEYTLSLPYGERVYQKRRFFLDYEGVSIDIDWGFVKDINDYGDVIKIDINVPEGGLPNGFLLRFMKALPSMGIVIKDWVNPYWIQSPAIGKRIEEIMERVWNLAQR